ncbi:HAD family hydrolase [Microbacteriaceae bacterium VKM Ac-2855]|nr:HAD family hydrolase [Microbacteriaceae bacterium VKM Ac-2855]
MVSAALFDIDGTLIDSNYLHVEAWAHALAEVGHPTDAWRIHRCIGMDSAKLLDTLVGEEVAAEIGDHASGLHGEYYDGLADRLRSFDGARELLETLADRGMTVVLATSAPEDELEQLRRVLSADHVVADVTSSGDVETAKPEPGIVESALKKAGTAPGDALFVGDTVWDIEAAARAGVRCIAVTSGGIAEAELRDAGAIAVYDDVASLLRELDTSPFAE